jgi:hypothetical protein
MVTHCPDSFQEMAGSFGYFSAFEIRLSGAYISDMAEDTASADLIVY